MMTLLVYNLRTRQLNTTCEEVGVLIDSYTEAKRAFISECVRRAEEGEQS